MLNNEKCSEKKTVGIIGGMGAAVSLFLFGEIFSMPIFADIRILGAIVGISVVFGVIAALLPAKSAAQLNPIDALRN